MRLYIGLFVGSLGLSVPAHAASLVSTFTTPSQTGGSFVETTQTAEDFSGQVSASKRVEYDQPSPLNGFAYGGGSLFADPFTGILKLSASANASDLNIGKTGSAQASIVERFTAQGNGIVRFEFDYDGALSVVQSGTAAASVLAEMSMSEILPDGGFSRVASDTSLFRLGKSAGGLSGTDGNGQQLISLTPPFEDWEVADILAFDLAVMDGASYQFGLKMQVSAGSAPGFSGAASANFGNTGYLTFSTSPSLNFLASDPNFLSTATGRPDPSMGGGMTPVPIPASLPLLLGGFAVLGMIGRRCQKV